MAIELLALVREELEEDRDPGRVAPVTTWSGVGLGAAWKRVQ